MIERDFDIMEKRYINIADFLSRQFNKDGFYRYDLMVRYLFIKRFYSLNKPDNFTHDLYGKFYKQRKVKERSKKFIRIINSFEEKGFSEEYKPYMIMNEKYKMCGGNHRTACCLWFDIRKIPVYVSDDFYSVCKVKKRQWNKKWLISHDLKNYIPKLEKVRIKIFKKLGI